MRVVAECELRPTEDEERVIRALKAFFDPERVSIEVLGPVRIVRAESGTLQSLQKLHRALRLHRILDAARSVLVKGRSEGSITFYMHKQAAYAMKPSFVSGDHESPLGAIKFVIFHPRPKEVIDWLAPKTLRGKPLWENPIPE